MNALKGMDVFVAVARAESVSRGAAMLQISAAQASQQVKKIEKQLGVLLIDRSTRHLRLTEEGRAFYESASEILAAVEDAERRISEMGATAQGRLRVEAPITLIDHVILPCVASFREFYPKITLEFLHSEQLYGATHPECEVIVRLGPFADSGLVAHSLGSVVMSAFASPAYLEKHPAPRHPSELENHHCINFVDPVSGAIHPWTFQRGEEEFSITPVAGIAFNQGGSRLVAALAGLGIYFGLDLGLEDHVASGKLQRVLQDWSTPAPPILVAYAGGRILSRRARCFVDHLRSSFTRRTNGIAG